MTDRSSTMVATTLGAVIGAMAGYMLFTDRGRAFRRELEPALEDVARELVHLRGTVQKVAEVASEGWKLLNDTAAETPLQPPRYTDPHQTTPF